MKRRFAALFLCLIYITVTFSLAGCTKKKGSGAGYTFNYTLEGNPKTLDPQLARDASSKTVIGNLFAGLYRLDPSGNVTPDVAKDCVVSADGLTYTITMRQNSFWLAKEKDAKGAETSVTATDFVFAFYRIFDPEIGSDYGDQFSCLKNAAEILAGSKNYDTIGVEAADPYTLVFTLAYPNANFLSLLATTAAMPCCAGFYYNCGGRYGLDEDSVISNGAFYLNKWFYDPYGKDNLIYLKKNAETDKNETVYPSHLTFYIAKDAAEVQSDFDSKKSDCIVTENAAYAKQSDYVVSVAASETLGLIFNPEHPQLRNASLREALALSLSRPDYGAALSDDVATACALVPPAVSLLGRPYRELVAEASFLREDEAAAQTAYHKAMGELKAQSLPGAEILVPSGLMDYAVLHNIIRRWSDLFGVYFSIKEVTPADYQKRLDEGDYSVALYTLTADWGSPPNVLEQFLTDPLLKPDDAIAEKLGTLLHQTRSLSSLSDSIELFREAESTALAGHSFLPLFYKNRYLVCREGNADIRLDPFTGQVFFREAKFFD